MQLPDARADLQADTATEAPALTRRLYMKTFL
jgi:hypothetical protein